MREHPNGSFFKIKSDFALAQFDRFLGVNDLGVKSATGQCYLECFNSCGNNINNLPKYPQSDTFLTLFWKKKCTTSCPSLFYLSPNFSYVNANRPVVLALPNRVKQSSVTTCRSSVLLTDEETWMMHTKKKNPTSTWICWLTSLFYPLKTHYYTSYIIMSSVWAATQNTQLNAKVITFIYKKEKKHKKKGKARTHTQSGNLC